MKSHAKILIGNITERNLAQHHKICHLILDFTEHSIELWRPKNPANTYARHTENLDSYFEVIRSHQ